MYADEQEPLCLQVMTALQRGALEEDGEITMIFERYAGNVN